MWTACPSRLDVPDLSDRLKIIIVVVALVGAGVATWLSFGGEEVSFPDQLAMVCVASGKTYMVDRDTVRTYPTVNPDTEQRTLVPVDEQNGKQIVPARYRAVLESIGERNVYVDLKTMEVRQP